MRRPAVLAVSMASLVLAVVPASSADAGNTTSDLPAGWAYTSTPCSGTASGTFTHVIGPSTPSFGLGSLEVMQPAATIGDLEYDFTNETAGGLATASLSTVRPADGALGQVLIMASGGGGIDELLATLPSTDLWQTTDLTALAYHVYEQPPLSGTFNDLGYQTWTQYKTANSSASLVLVDVEVSTCTESRAGSFYVDRLAVSDNGTTVVTDFEPDPTSTSVTITGPSTSVSGGAVKLSTTVTHGGGPVAGATSGGTVTLLARPAGTSTFVPVATLAPNSSGVASSTQHPTVTTTYRWDFNGDQADGPGSSSQKTVKVATRLTLHVADTTLSTTQPLVTWGAESPIKSGATVTLWRKVSGPDVKVGSAKVGTDGTWSLQKDLAKGKYPLYAKVAATTKNTAGTSATITVSAA